MISFRGRKALAALALLAGVLLAQQASAVCRVTAAGFIPQDVSLSMGRVIVPPKMAIGGTIKKQTFMVKRDDSVVTCIGGGSSASSFLNASQQNTLPGIAGVHPTDVEGVGIRLSGPSGLGDYPWRNSLPNPEYRVTRQYELVVELIKTADRTGSGPIAKNGRFAVVYYDGDGPSKPAVVHSFLGTGTVVVSPTCEVDAGSRNISVNFGSVSNSRFTGVGSKSANQDFVVRLNCQSSNGAQLQVRTGIRLDGPQDSSNMPGVLKLSESSNMATRIGIELVQRDGPAEREVRLGQTIYFDSSTGTVTLPLRARYIQVQPGTVGAGIANGEATFTIQYE